MDNFIEEYLRLTETVESPTAYLKWGAISCLSATLRDNVYFSFPERLSKLYPNTYILILGDTGARKAAPFDINERLLRGEKGVNNTKVIAGQATLQGVLKILSTTETGQPFGGSGLMLAREASGFFIRDQQTIGTLTDIYEFHPNWDKALASYDIQPIKNLCLSMFAGTNEVMIQQMLDTTAKEGGFLGRCILVEGTGRRHRDSGMEEHGKYPKEEKWIPMVAYLKQLATVKGPILFSNDAKRHYNRWYKDFDYEEYHTKTGYETRMGSHILKLSTILSAATPAFENRTIDVPALELAINTCTDLLINYKKMTYGSGQSPTSQFTIPVTSLLLNAKDNKLTRMKILHDLYGQITGTILDEITKDLIDSGQLKEVFMSGMPGYQLTDKFLNKFHTINNSQKKAQGS